MWLQELSKGLAIDTKTIGIVRELLREYYSRCDLILPTDFSTREIAMQPLTANTYIRHLSFSSSSELIRTIVENVPRHLYYSSARYQEPANPIMDEKRWMGSDLVFDIDANEIPSCIEGNKVIQLRFCRRCGYIVEEPEAKECPYCKLALERFDHIDVECIRVAQDHAARLISILREDFGFTNIVVAFSGHRGFHVVVELDESYRYMDSDDRREIASYIKLDDQRIKYFVEQLTKIPKQKQFAPLPPRITDGGVRRRIALSLAKYADEEVKAYIFGLKPLLTFAEALKAYDLLIRNLNNVISEIPIAIDTKVTVDITHLVRIPNSINGKTGWRAMHIKDLDLSEFEISSQELAALDAKIRIKFLIDIPKLTLIDTKFHFRRGDEVSLDYPYASYFIFKEVALATNIVR